MAKYIKIIGLINLQRENEKDKLLLNACNFLFLAMSQQESKTQSSGAPWVKKCSKLPIRENLVIT